MKNFKRLVVCALVAASLAAVAAPAFAASLKELAAEKVKQEAKEQVKEQAKENKDGKDYRAQPIERIGCRIQSCTTTDERQQRSRTKQHSRYNGDKQRPTPKLASCGIPAETDILA